MAERLHKVLARMGVGSRREIERWIKQGLVEVDGQVAQLGQTSEGVQRVSVNGVSITLAADIPTQFIQYHKPDNEICSRKDPENRQTVYDHLPTLSQGRWVAIGRLDLTTSGILLFTTNGELANALMHPSAGVDREYLVRVHGRVTPEALHRLQQGVKLDDGIARFTDVQERSRKRTSGSTNQWVQVVLQEGRNHEVKRMFESQGLQVTRLIRIRFGPIVLDDNLRKGHHRNLTNNEVKALNAIVRQAK